MRKEDVGSGRVRNSSSLLSFGSRAWLRAFPHKGSADVRPAHRALPSVQAGRALGFLMTSQIQQLQSQLLSAYEALMERTATFMSKVVYS